jgi:hypothetical protein
MRIRNTILVLLLLAMLCGCETLNKGVSQPERLRVKMSAPVGTGPSGNVLGGCETANFTVDIVGGKAPYQIAWDFGGAAENTVSIQEIQGSNTVGIQFIEVYAQTTFTAMATVTDSTRLSDFDLITFSFRETENSMPVLELLEYRDGIVTVQGYDFAPCIGGRAPVSFHAYVESGNVSVSPEYIHNTNFAEFSVSPIDILAGSLFTVGVTVDDGSASTSDSISGSFDPFPLEPDTLYAIATKSRASVNESVRVVVATGLTASPMMYLDEFGVVCESGAQYLHGSFDTGEIDADPDPGIPVDGVWAQLGAASFLILDDRFIGSTDLWNGTRRTDFSVLPLLGRELQVSGVLFNFEYRFRNPGTYTLGFEAVNETSRTFYLDSTATTEFFWSIIDNAHQYNTIVVE